MDRLVSQVFFPIFTIAHGVVWHTCKFHENDGICVQLFGLPWDGNHHNETTPVEQHPTPFWKRLFKSQVKEEERQLELEILKRQQHYRLELVRELNLALVVLGIMAIFSKNETVRTQLLIVEAVVFGIAAWDAWNFAEGSQLIVPMLLLALTALFGLIVQVGQDHEHFRQLFRSLDRARGVEDSFPEPTKEMVTEEIKEVAREIFDKLPPEVEALMNQSAEEVEPSDKTRLFMDESSVTATAVKPEKSASVGISVKKIGGSWRNVISALGPDGLFADGPLKVGQTILAINDIPATEFHTAKDVTDIIRESTEVTIVATKSIRVRVVKPTQDTLVGISFSKSKREGSLHIHKINADSIFQGTALEVGMRVLAINNKPCPSSLTEACNLTKATKGSLILIVVKDDAEQAETNEESNQASSMVTKAVSKIEPLSESAPPRPTKQDSVLDAIAQDDLVVLSDAKAEF